MLFIFETLLEILFFWKKTNIDERKLKQMLSSFIRNLHHKCVYVCVLILVL